MAINRSKKASVAGWEDPNLAAPIFPQALNGTSGLIWRPHLDSDGGLRVDCPIWAFPDDGDVLQIEFSVVGQAFWIPLDPIFFPVQPSGPFVQVTINIAPLGHGEFDLRFKVRPGSGSDYLDFSAQQRVRIDLYGPYKAPGKSEAPARVGWPASLPLGVDITQETLDLNPGGFELDIPGYGDYEAGDTVARVWLTAIQPPDDAPSLGSKPMEAGGTVFNVPISAIADMADGILFAYCQFVDAAGNYSEISRIPTGRRLKRSANLNLDPLVIVAPPSGGMVDIEAWQAGVKGAIPQYAWEPSDQYRLHWGDQTTALAPLSGVFPFEFTVPGQLIVDEYADQEGPVSVTASYDIIRTGSTNSPTDDTLVSVDLSVVGPPGPVPGEPSPDLDIVTITGPASAPTTNYLNSADIDHVGPILATFDLWSVDPEPEEDDVVTLYWGSKLNPAGSYTVGPGDGPGTEVEIEVDKTAIAAGGNGDDIPLFYGVSRSGASNSNYSDSTSVRVDDAITHQLDPAEFLHLGPWSMDPRGRLICDSLRPTDAGTPWSEKYVEVRIPPNSEFFADGKQITVEFVASTGLLGDIPIEATRGTASVTLDAEMAAKGFIFQLKPFDPHLKVVGAAAPWNTLWFQYSLDIAGTPARSIPAVVPIRMVTSNNYCDGTPA